ncbi:MAG: hypothetical protein MRERV_3c127, partial [Mycoplasmataceae bacterium RV_VA103A]
YSPLPHFLYRYFTWACTLACDGKKQESVGKVLDGEPKAGFWRFFGNLGIMYA